MQGLLQTLMTKINVYVALPVSCNLSIQGKLRAV